MEWAALITWVITALFGFTMLVIWLRHGGLRQQTGGKIPPWLIISHFLLAASGRLWIVTSPPTATRSRGSRSSSSRSWRCSAGRCSSVSHVAVKPGQSRRTPTRRQTRRSSASRCGRRAARAPRRHDGRARLPRGSGSRQLDADVDRRRRRAVLEDRAQSPREARGASSLRSLASSSSSVHQRTSWTCSAARSIVGAGSCSSTRTR